VFLHKIGGVGSRARPVPARRVMNQR
jgi:hypothetical protein